MHQMSLKNVIEDQNFWYSDGNVILAVTNTPSRNTDDMNLNVTLLSISGNESSAVQETLIDGKSQEVVLFRVHKSILSKHSQVFADMFSLPDVPSLSESGDENLTANETYSNVPVVYLSDTAEKVRDVLSILYDPLRVILHASSVDEHSLHHPSSFNLQQHEDLSYERLNALIDISEKYQIDVIINQLVSRIEADWPLTLQEWDRYEIVSRNVWKTGSFPCTWPREMLPEPVTAIKLAQRLGIKSVLPAAFYDLTRIRYSDDWDQCVKEKEFCVHRKGARWKLLTAADHMQLGLVRDASISLLRNLGLVAGVCRDREHPQACTGLTRNLFPAWISAISRLQDRISSNVDRDTLRKLREPLEKGIFQPEFPTDFCNVCAGSVIEQLRLRREETWSAITKTCKIRFYLWRKWHETKPFLIS